MPRNARDVLPGYAHVTQRMTDRQVVFGTALDRLVYLDPMRESQNDAGVRILAFCLRGVEPRAGGHDRLCRSDTPVQFREPSQRGPMGWDARQRLLEGSRRRRGLAPSDGPQAQPRVLEHLLKRCTYSERPFGDSSFVAEVEGKLGKKWARWRYERELIGREIEKSLDVLVPKTFTVA